MKRARFTGEQGIFTAIGDYTRECLAQVIDTSLFGLRATRELNAVVALRRKPASIVSDNGHRVDRLGYPLVLPEGSPPDSLAPPSPMGSSAEQTPSIRITWPKPAKELPRGALCGVCALIPREWRALRDSNPRPTA